MYEHADNYRLGCAALSVTDCHDMGVSIELLARMLNAWWPRDTPHAGIPWTPDEAWMLVRCAGLAGVHTRLSLSGASIIGLARLVRYHRIVHNVRYGDDADNAIGALRFQSVRERKLPHYVSLPDDSPLSVCSVADLPLPKPRVAAATPKRRRRPMTPVPA